MADGKLEDTPARDDITVRLPGRGDGGRDGLDEALASFAPLAERMGELQASATGSLSPGFREALGRASETAGRASEALAPGLRDALASFGVTCEPSAEDVGHDAEATLEVVTAEARERLRDAISASIPKRVKLAQKRAGVSQTAMPKVSSVPKSTYMDIVKGKTRSPSLADLVCIAKATGTTLDFLVGLS